jgi:HEPN domain-containing protein
MRREESLNPADWIHIAERDYHRVETLLGIGDAEAAGFYLQQAIEKFLKAFLLSKGWRLRRIHDLDTLLNATLEFDDSTELFREVCQRITDYYIVERYPIADDSGLTVDDVRDSYEKVKGLVDMLREGAK